MIVLSYLWLLALIPLVVEKEDREVQWHAKHGLVLTVAELIFWVAFQVLIVRARIVPRLPGRRSSRRSSGWGSWSLHIFAIIKGINGQRLIIPGISQYADKF